MKSSRFIICILTILLPQLISANVRLHSLFADHMVVQRETEIPVWGWAEPGESVSVQLGKGKAVTTKANTT